MTTLEFTDKEASECDIFRITVSYAGLTGHVLQSSIR